MLTLLTILINCIRYEERVLQRLRGVRGQGDADEFGRRVTPQTIVDIVRNRTLK